jgi:phosphoglucomutase
VYLERYELVGGDDAGEHLAGIAVEIAAAESIAGIAQHTGRTAPDVIT